MLIRFHPLMAMITKLRSDSSFSCPLDVHVQPKAASIHLGRPDFDQIADRLLYGAADGGAGELNELLEQLGCLLSIIYALRHVMVLVRRNRNEPARHHQTPQTPFLRHRHIDWSNARGRQA
jgi:hypothetical protein